MAYDGRCYTGGVCSKCVLILGSSQVCAYTMKQRSHSSGVSDEKPGRA